MSAPSSIRSGLRSSSSHSGAISGSHHGIGTPGSASGSKNQAKSRTPSNAGGSKNGSKKRKSLLPGQKTLDAFLEKRSETEGQMPSRPAQSAGKQQTLLEFMTKNKASSRNPSMDQLNSIHSGQSDFTGEQIRDIELAIRPSTDTTEEQHAPSSKRRSPRESVGSRKRGKTTRLDEIAAEQGIDNKDLDEHLDNEDLNDED